MLDLGWHLYHMDRPVKSVCVQATVTLHFVQYNHMLSYDPPPFDNVIWIEDQGIIYCWPFVSQKRTLMKICIPVAFFCMQMKRKLGATAEYSPHFHTAVRLEFKSGFLKLGLGFWFGLGQSYSKTRVCGLYSAVALKIVLHFVKIVWKTPMPYQLYYARVQAQHCSKRFELQ